MATTIKPRKRTTPRVADTEDQAKSPKKLVGQSMAKPEGFIKLIDGELHIIGQLAETVPIAQYANVVLGPVQLAWKLGGVNMEELIDVDWEQIEDSDDLAKVLTPKQLAVWNRARGGMRATMMLIEFTIAEDRETVERSIRDHNEREADKKKK